MLLPSRFAEEAIQPIQEGPTGRDIAFDKAAYADKLTLELA